MKEKNDLTPFMLIATVMLERGWSEVRSDHYHFNEGNVQKLEQSIAYKSQLYYDALKSIH